MFLSAAAAIRAVQFEKQSAPIITAGERMSFVRAEHPSKAPNLIVVTESGMVMAVREEHRWKV
jgi:hypothetical protein